MERFEDIAIPISWPDKTARGDERWMAWLKNIGLVKNLNFKIGHAAILLIEKKTGKVLYFDFGRYITPRGYGRARSALSDPRLQVKSSAAFEPDGQLLNLEEILAELAGMESATHGGGRLLCAVATQISFKRSRDFAERLVEQGPIIYGALAHNNNSCSRYVAQIMVAGMARDDKRKQRILYPEFIKASPTSNVVNGRTDSPIFSYFAGSLTRQHMNRIQSAQFHFRQLYANFTTHGSRDLGDDSQPGHTAEPVRSKRVPKHAQWLGGIGEGRWFVLDRTEGRYQISRLDEMGDVDYRVICRPESDFDPNAEYRFTYEVHHQKHSILQQGKTIAFHTENCDLAHELETNEHSDHYIK